MMKNYIPIIAAALFLVACSTQQEKGPDVAEVTPGEPEQARRTYAEISHNTGGAWKDRMYEGGKGYTNVDSLRVPDEHTDHSNYIRYEGPGWESDMIGYRLYLDWRNATDIFGKLTDEMVLHKVGQDSHDSYHEPAEWGMDILKVGNSLGIGSVGRLVNGEMQHFREVDSTVALVSNTQESSSVTVNYYGWKTGNETMDLTSVYSIQPDSRVTKHTLLPSKPLEGLSTGIVKHDSAEFIKKTSDNGEWGYIATYGVQTLVPDKLGMAIFYRTADVAEQREGKDDHLVIFKPSDQELSFYFLGAWEQEPGGIKTKEEFVSYLDGMLGSEPVQ